MIALGEAPHLVEAAGCARRIGRGHQQDGCEKK
jgi:hypothetical protein